MKQACTLKKLKEYYYSVLKDVIEAGGSFETFQQRLMLETSFGVPAMGLSFNTFRWTIHRSIEAGDRSADFPFSVNVYDFPVNWLHGNYIYMENNV